MTIKHIVVNTGIWICLILLGTLLSSGALYGTPSGLFSVETIEALYELDSYPNGGPILDGDVVLVQGYWDKNDGGGGLFLYDSRSTQNPVFDDVSYFKVGFNSNFDGMVAKSVLRKKGRWLRQWGRDKLNLRWFGGSPGNRADCSLAFNAALRYAQFEVAGWGTMEVAHPFNNRIHTQSGKTIYLPSGSYYFRSALQTITHGVVIEGEGNVGTSAQGTRILVMRNRTQEDIKITGITNDRFGFFRYHANQVDNSGGGLKNLSIEVHPAYRFDANVVTLNALANNPNPIGQVAPRVSNWSAENVLITMSGKARRAFYLEGEDVKEGLPFRIKDIVLVNCWLVGGSISGQTIMAQNVSGLHIMGGKLNSEEGSCGAILPGIYLGGAQGCAHVRLDGVDLTQGIIDVRNRSRFLRIACSYGRLQIDHGPDAEHENLQIVMTHLVNPRKDKIQPDCPDGYTCYWD